MSGKHRHGKNASPVPPEHPEPKVAEEKAPGRIELARDEFERLQAQAMLASEYQDKLLRALADADNYRKRLEKEKKEFMEFSNQDFILSLLPILDNFERALAAIPSGNSADPYRQGIEMIYKQFKEALGKEGLQEIAARGSRFDPFFHEAVEQEETAACPDGTVLEELQKGYLLKGRLLRSAVVKVSKAPAASGAPVEGREQAPPPGEQHNDQ